MRTIKFRVFDKHKKYMHELDALFLDEKMFRVQNYKNEHDVFSFGTEYFSEPMQFTGLQDNNGIEMFEGDIVECRGWNNTEREWKKHFKVSFDDGCFCLEDNDGKFYGVFKRTIVIGNIFQHPHLLEANHD